MKGRTGGPRARAALLAAVVLGTGACYDFHLTGPEDPPPVSPPRLVSVAIEYRQPAGCVGPKQRCDDLVVFFGSWMRPGAEFFLTPDPGNYTWRGVALGVPVNYPPTERPTPYEVRIYDPHLLGTSTEGHTGDRLRVGGEFLTQIVDPGRPNEHSAVFVDENGQGHNPF